MTTITQLDPQVPVYIPELSSKGMAILVIDYGIEHHLHWVVALDNTEIWTFPNPRVRMQFNQTIGRK